MESQLRQASEILVLLNHFNEQDSKGYIIDNRSKTVIKVNL